MQYRQPLRGARGSRAVDSQAERGGGDGAGVGQEKRSEINTHCLAAGGKQKPIKKKKNNNKKEIVGGMWGVLFIKSLQIDVCLQDKS